MSESNAPSILEADLDRSLRPLHADLYFRVRSLPIAKPRQSRRDRFDPSRSVQFYHAWADLVRLAARQAYLEPGLQPSYEGAIALACVFTFPVPARWNKAKTAAALDGRIYHTSKPDLDNLIKGLKDPLSGVLWPDDRAVVRYVEPCEKRYGTAEQVGCSCWIWSLENDRDCVSAD